MAGSKYCRGTTVQDVTVWEASVVMKGCAAWAHDLQDVLHDS